MTDDNSPKLVVGPAIFPLEVDEAETLSGVIRAWALYAKDPAKRTRWHVMADALHVEPEPAADALPPHRRADAPSQRCDDCGRTTYTVTKFNTWCMMPQPSGRLCDGRFKP